MQFDSSRPSHHRRVRSFVRREGRGTPAQKRAMEMLWPKFGFVPEGVLDLGTLFNRDAPSVLEIGFGDGEALIDAARKNPEKNFIGVEVYTPGVGHCLLAIENEQLGNLRLCRDDAIELLENHIPDASLSDVRLFFPDPWPKKKHHKRRIVKPGFLSLIARKLISGGQFHFATDWEAYAYWSLELLEASPNLYNVSGKGNFSTKPDSRIVTKFERRGQRLGHGSWDLIYRTQQA